MNRKLFVILSVLTAFVAVRLTAQIPVMDGSGTVLTIAEKPRRIISLSPAATEVLFASGCGAQVVARTSLCTYPEAAQSVPVLGGFDGKTFSVEAIIALRPDFVYGTAGMHDYVRTALAKLNIPVFLSNAATVNDVINELTMAGSLSIAGSVTAQNAVKKIQWERSAVKKMLLQRNKAPLRVYWEIWNKPPMSAGKGSFMNDMIVAAGGENICGDIPLAYPEVSAEFVITMNPQIIIVPSDSFSGSVKDAQRYFAARGGWEHIDAVKNCRIIIADADLVSRCGPRIGEAIIYLSRAFYPELWNGDTSQ